ncbi:DUF6059 family protein [Streptomyces caeni]|uniref:DUF6059 family protein n=1 Tax=Streptomyces caeni TaxID=2307231 RepID=A0ABW4IUP1_9ACTN
MKRLWRGGRGRRALDCCLRALLRSLAALGALYVGPVVLHHALSAAASPPRLHGPFPPHASGGPPPAHPERLCEDTPLSEEERLRARELWPAYYRERRAPDGG